MQNNILRNLGVLARKGQKAISGIGKSFKAGSKKAQIHVEPNGTEGMRSVIVQEIRSILNEGHRPGSEIEKRLEMINEAVMQLQEQITHNRSRGSANDEQIHDALSSISEDKGLDDEEKSVLETVFKQNLVLQGRS